MKPPQKHRDRLLESPGHRAPPWRANAADERRCVSRQPTTRLLGAVIASLVLTAAFGWSVARSDDARLMRETMSAARADQPISPDKENALWESLERGRFRSVWLFCPAVALLVGLFTGVLAPRHAGALAALGVAPFAILFSVGEGTTKLVLQTKGVERELR
jgi:hypothetical protein